MSNRIMTEKLKEVEDCGQYITIRQDCCIFKKWIVGVTVTHERYHNHIVRIKTVNSCELNPAFSYFCDETDAMEFAKCVMEMCCTTNENFIMEI